MTETNVYGFTDVGSLVKTFWISWYCWLEEDPETPYPYWITGQGMQYKLKKRFESQYPEHVGKIITPGWCRRDPLVDPIDEDDTSDDWFDEACVPIETVCAIIEAADEESAYAVAAEHFAIHERRFCEDVEMSAEQFREKLRSSGRFL